MSMTFVPLLGFWLVLCALSVWGFVLACIEAKNRKWALPGLWASMAALVVIGSAFFITQEQADIEKRQAYEAQLAAARAPQVYRVDP